MGNPTYWEKKVSLLAFRQVLAKILPEACTQLHNYHLFEKAWLKLIPIVQNSGYLPGRVSPRITCQVSPFLTKMSKSCFTHQVWTVPHSPESLSEALGMGENPTQHAEMYSSSPSEKFPVIDLKLLLLKV